MAREQPSYLPRHDAAVPATGLSLPDARREVVGGNVAVATALVFSEKWRAEQMDDVQRSRLADHELVERPAGRRELEQRRARERAPRLGQETVTVVVHALVVELDVPLRG
jgi:hypothetical protein